MTKTFDAMIMDAFNTATALSQERKNLEEQVKVAKGREDQAYKVVSHLNRIAYLAGFDHNVMEWAKLPRTDYASSFCLAWRDIWALETSMFIFRVIIDERTDLRKHKFVVEVRVSRRGFSEHPNDIHGAYTDYDYAKDKYMNRKAYNDYKPIVGQELIKKFTNVEDALAFANQWMERLYRDHQEEIDSERSLRQNCIESGFKFDRDKRWAN